MQGTVNVYSLKKDGNTKLSQNFKVKEFKCKDGSDVILIHPELVHLLQLIRDHFGKAVHINSGYRTPTYNKKVGGATHSQHLYGMACDIRITGVSPKTLYEYADWLLNDHGGVGLYSSFVHVDVRPKKSRWKE